MRRVVAIVISTACVLGMGVYHGVATDRWLNTEDDSHPGKWLAELPLQIGEWKGELLPRDVDDDPKTGVVNCRFSYGSTGRWVVTSVTSGRGGRVSIHNPEHCYLGSGYKVVDSIHSEEVTVEGVSSALWTGHFEKKKSTGTESIRIHWGWTKDGRWQAPDYPRWSFMGAPRLHKVYVIHPVTSNDSPADLALYQEFLVAYLTELNHRLAR